VVLLNLFRRGKIGKSLLRLKGLKNSFNPINILISQKISSRRSQESMRSIHKENAPIFSFIFKHNQSHRYSRSREEPARERDNSMNKILLHESLTNRSFTTSPRESAMRDHNNRPPHLLLHAINYMGYERIVCQLWRRHAPLKSLVRVLPSHLTCPTVHSKRRVRHYYIKP